jgi:hypothetical protein
MAGGCALERISIQRKCNGKTAGSSRFHSKLKDGSAILLSGARRLFNSLSQEILRFLAHGCGR